MINSENEITPAVSFFSVDKKLSKEVLHLAYPVVIGMISITAIGVTDTMMVGRLGAEALAATGQSAIIFWSMLWAMRSVEVAAQALIARRYGERQYDQCGKILDNALVVVFTVSVFATAALWFGARALMSALSSHETVIDYAVSFIRIFVSALWASGLLSTMRGFFSGIGKTRIFLFTSSLMMITNIFFNYVFIFGKFGFPALGVRGSALGSVTAYIITFGFMMFYILGGAGINYRKDFSLFRLRNIDRMIINDIVRLASPNAFRGIMVMGGLSVFYAMVDKIDVIQVAIVNVVLNIQSVSFMPGYGFGVAAATLIGQNLGANNPLKAERAAYEAVKLGIVFMGTLGLFFLIVPEWVVQLFTNDPAVIENAQFPLRVVGVVQIIDAVGMVLSSALDGAGNTRWVMKAEIFVNWCIFIPLTYFLTFTFGLDRYGPWLAWGSYMLVFGVICLWKFREGSWKHIKI